MSLYQRLHETAPGAPSAAGAGRDPLLDELRQRVHGLLIDELGPLLYDRRVGEDELSAHLQEQLRVILGRERIPLSTSDREQLLQDVTEVMVNGPGRVYVERAGKLTLTGATFADEAHLRRIIEKIVAQVGRRVDEATPMVDARLPDGSRVNAIIPPLAIGGPFLTIRKFAKDPFTVD